MDSLRSATADDASARGRIYYDAAPMFARRATTIARHREAP